MYLKKSIVLLSIILIGSNYSYSNDDAPAAFDPANVHTALGIPFDQNLEDDFIIHTNIYSLSYNKNTGSPNWVAWNLNSSWYGDVSRFKGKFKKADDYLPGDFYVVSHDDYTHSGYDRGHLVRSKERTRTKDHNKATFYMINIIPQTPDLNRGVWLDFEYECERLCLEENKELFVIAGGVYHEHNKLNEHVEIPDSCYKIVVVLDSGQSLSTINNDTEVIAVMMPNIKGIRKDDWEKYVTSIDRIEFSTGYDFLHKIPDFEEDQIEAKVIEVETEEEVKANKGKKTKR